LLQLKQHIPAIVVVLEEVDVVENKNQWTPCATRTTQGNLLQLVQGCQRSATTALTTRSKAITSLDIESRSS
jgi:hypothetical protein